MRGHAIALSYDPVETGGWFCYGPCQAFTELNMDREMNTCARCGRPTVKLLPPPMQGPEDPPRPRPAPVNEARAGVLFKALRKAIE